MAFLGLIFQRSSTTTTMDETTTDIAGKYKLKIDDADIPTFEHGMTQQQTIEFYDRITPHYEKITFSTGYKGPMLAAREIMAHFPTRRDIRILDGGAGTGLVGEELARDGFTHIDAIEPSKDMLSKLKEKDVYSKVICDIIGTNKLPIEDNSYDSLTLIGVIAAGAVSHECFPEIIRIVKPGGIIITTCREDAILVDPYLKEHIEPEMKRLHDNGSWRWLKRETIPDYIDAYDGFFAVFEVL